MKSTVTITFNNGDKVKVKKADSVGFGEGFLSVKKGDTISYYPTYSIQEMEQTLIPE